MFEKKKEHNYPPHYQTNDVLDEMKPPTGPGSKAHANKFHAEMVAKIKKANEAKKKL